MMVTLIRLELRKLKNTLAPLLCLSAPTVAVIMAALIVLLDVQVPVWASD